MDLALDRICYRIEDAMHILSILLDNISPAIIFKHDRALTTEDQAHEWFGILPER